MGSGLCTIIRGGCRMHNRVRLRIIIPTAFADAALTYFITRDMGRGHAED
jgi:hypothetical protein